MDYYFGIILYLLLISRTWVQAHSPVVIVPGAPGSQIEAKLHHKVTPAWYCSSTTSSWFTLWLSLTSLMPFKINCWIDNMRLQWDMQNMVVTSPPGVKTRVPGFGGTKTIETLDTHGFVKYMKPMVDYLRKMGYESGKDLRGAPYDFRYSPESLPDNFHAKLKVLIEETYSLNGNKKVSIISHSYGCVVTQYFLMLQSQEWKDKYLKQWIPLAGIFGGSKQEMYLYSSGYLEGVPGIIVDRLKMRSSQRSGTSNLWMLPSPTAWPSNEVLVKTKKRIYTIADMDDFLWDIQFPQGIIMRNYITNSSYFMSKPPGVPIHCFYGHIPNSTIDRVEFDDDFPDNPSNVVMGDGDGTVNIQSLQLCQHFADLVNVTKLKGVKHEDIISNEIVLQAIRGLL